MAERRSKSQIIQDILELVQRKGKIKPTHILYGGNLSHDRLKKFMNELEEKGFVEKLEEKKHTFYKLTDKGAQFIVELKRIREIESAFGI